MAQRRQAKRVETFDDWKDIFQKRQSDINYDSKLFSSVLDGYEFTEKYSDLAHKRLLDATHGKEPVTYNMVLQILQDEVAHEEDLQSLAEDLDGMLKR